MFHKENNQQAKKGQRFYKKMWFKILMLVFLFLIIGGGVFAWKAGSTIKKISQGGFMSTLAHNIPGVKDELKGEKEGRINVLLLGMRGENVPGGGLLADTIMVASFIPKENKVAMISVPRDLYVDNPGWANKSKINAVYAAGEENGKKQGMKDMQKVVGDVTGLSINYGISINFAGFKQLIDAIGGVEITLEQPFSESVQFLGLEKRCDGNIFTVPSGNFEEKRIQRKNGTYYANPKRYALCFARESAKSELECGGNFTLPVGKNTLNGDSALCYARSRATSSDFERAKRQQVIIQAVKDKLLSAGTLTDFGKMNAILKSLGDNAKVDMELWEMQRFYDLYKEQQLGNTQVAQRVLENSEEGLLYNPTNMPKEVGYILLPIGDNYDRIREMAKNIFTLPPQSDIKPK